MVDVKKIIQDMVRTGMDKDQVVSTLKELGVPNAEEVFQEATEKLREVEVPAGEAPLIEARPIEEEKKPVLELEKIIEESPAPQETRELVKRLDEMEALLKALQETVKQVLETDRNVLLRLKEKA